LETSTAAYVVVLITVPSTEVGRQVARALLDQRLAACVNLVPGVNSLYVWDGQLQDDEEVLLVVKTRSELFTRLVPAVRAVHPYTVPEIIALPVLAGSRDYLDWIEDATKNA
jgi:periplasmic divalent cation tolerance protein